MKNWKNIGPVFVKAYNGSSKEFNSLKEAVQYLGEYNITKMIHGRLAFWSSYIWYGLEKKSKPESYKTFDYAKRAYDRFERGDPFVIYDELGFIIPVWRIHEEWDANKVERKYYRSWFGGRYSRHRSNQIKHRSLIRDWNILDNDEDLTDKMIYSLKNGKKPREIINYVMTWDYLESRKTYEKNWKTQRKTQYKT